MTADYQLTAASTAAIDKGTTVSMTTSAAMAASPLNAALFAGAFNQDVAKQTVPCGPAPDIGASEYCGGTTLVWPGPANGNGCAGTGGAPAAGGASGSGGSPGTGGAAGGDGGRSTGGNAGSGGNRPTGGASGSGGSASTVTGTGGASAVANGGAVQSTGTGGAAGSQGSDDENESYVNWALMSGSEGE